MAFLRLSATFCTEKNRARQSFSRHNKDYTYLPVNDLPDTFDVIRTKILVLQVVRVLPDVDSQDGSKTGGHARVLVCRRRHRELSTSFVEAQPTPSRALNGDSRGGKLVLHRRKRSKVSLDHLQQFALRKRVVLWRREAFPEQCVVDVSATVEFDRRLHGNHGGVITLRFRLRVLLLSDVKVRHVRVVVLLMVNFHDLCTNNRLQGGEVVVEIGKFSVHEGPRRVRRRLDRRRGRHRSPHQFIRASSEHPRRRQSEVK